MPQEICLLLPVRPKSNSVGKRVHRLAVAPDKGSAKVDVFYLVLFGLEVGDLADVVTKCVKNFRISKNALERGRKRNF